MYIWFCSIHYVWLGGITVNREWRWMKIEGNRRAKGPTWFQNDRLTAHTSDWSLGDTKCNATKSSLIFPSLLIFQIFFVSNFLITFNEWSLSKLTKMPSSIFNDLFFFFCANNDLFYFQNSLNVFEMIDFKTFSKLF